MRNFFLEKSYTKFDVEIIPRPFSIFIVSQVEDYRNILKLNCRLLAFTLCKDFLKTQKEVWNWSR